MHCWKNKSEFLNSSFPETKTNICQLQLVQSVAFSRTTFCLFGCCWPTENWERMNFYQFYTCPFLRFLCRKAFSWQNFTQYLSVDWNSKKTCALNYSFVLSRWILSFFITVRFYRLKSLIIKFALVFSINGSFIPNFDVKAILAKILIAFFLFLSRAFLRAKSVWIKNLNKIAA